MGMRQCKQTLQSHFSIFPLYLCSNLFSTDMYMYDVMDSSDLQDLSLSYRQSSWWWETNPFFSFGFSYWELKQIYFRKAIKIIIIIYGWKHFKDLFDHHTYKVFGNSYHQHHTSLQKEENQDLCYWIDNPSFVV